jgi:DNA-binding response OmpR family regulator
MGTPVSAARIIRFGLFEVELKAGELRKHGLRLKLSEQPFQVLAVLLENRARLSPAKNCALACGRTTRSSALITA